MNISRKDFFRRGLLSLGEAVCRVSAGLQAPVVGETDREEEPAFVATDRNDLVAVAHNGDCLAVNFGCFSCEERCDAHAISLVMGAGIRIDEARCTGCGICEYVCPATPKAVTIAPRG